MSVAYIRTYELEYDVVPSDQQLKAINTLLMQENLPAIDRWDTEVLEDKYGLVDKVTKTETYAVGWEIDGEQVDKVLFFEYQSRADSVVEDLSAVVLVVVVVVTLEDSFKVATSTFAFLLLSLYLANEMPYILLPAFVVINCDLSCHNSTSLLSSDGSSPGCRESTSIFFSSSFSHTSSSSSSTACKIKHLLRQSFALIW